MDSIFKSRNKCRKKEKKKRKKKETWNAGNVKREKRKLSIQTGTKCVFGIYLKSQIILLFSLFLLLFIRGVNSG